MPNYCRDSSYKRMGARSPRQSWWDASGNPTTSRRIARLVSSPSREAQGTLALARDPGREIGEARSARSTPVRWASSAACRVSSRPRSSNCRVRYAATSSCIGGVAGSRPGNSLASRSRVTFSIDHGSGGGGASPIWRNKPSRASSSASFSWSAGDLRSRALDRAQQQRPRSSRHKAADYPCVLSPSY